jgi:Host cell surface-exposed lipoprotein
MGTRIIRWALVAATLAILLGSATTANAATTNRTQATRAAKQYLRISGFSKKSLIEQLKYDGYSTSDATYGATHAGANWMTQAVRSAKQYLHVSPFSFSGMVEQLQYDGYTRAQAVHGARAAGV